MDTNNRLRIAARIHFALMRYLGSDMVNVSRMLSHPNEAREVLWVCDSCGDVELLSLARSYRSAEAAELQARLAHEAAAVGHVEQETPWARDTSGFGLSGFSHPPAVAAVPRGAGALLAAWITPASWLRRGPSVRRTPSAR